MLVSMSAFLVAVVRTPLTAIVLITEITGHFEVFYPSVVVGGLPPELSEVHNVFHISQLRRCISPPEKRTDMAEIELANDLTYEERPIRILDETERVTHSKVIRFYYIPWEHHTEEEATWEDVKKDQYQDCLRQQWRF